MLHYLMVAELNTWRDKSREANAELRLIKKFADVDKLDVIKDILAES